MELKECKYRLPCSWCDKFDRPCDLRCGAKKECEHEWKYIGHQSSFSISIFDFICPKCGETKSEVQMR